MEEFLSLFDEYCIGSGEQSNFPVRVYHMDFFFQDDIKKMQETIRVPFRGFIQAKQESALTWQNWLAQHHSEIKFKKSLAALHSQQNM